MNSSNKFKALLNKYYHDLHALNISTSPSTVLVVLRVEHVLGRSLRVRKYKNPQGQEEYEMISSWYGIHKEEAGKETEFCFGAALLIRDHAH